MHAGRGEQIPAAPNRPRSKSPSREKASPEQPDQQRQHDRGRKHGHRRRQRAGHSRELGTDIAGGHAGRRRYHIAKGADYKRRRQPDDDAQHS